MLMLYGIVAFVNSVNEFNAKHLFIMLGYFERLVVVNVDIHIDSNAYKWISKLTIWISEHNGLCWHALRLGAPRERLPAGRTV